MKKVVCYHKSCYDGFGAAWAAYRALGTEGVTYIPVMYGDPLPIECVNAEEVYIVDFAYLRGTVMEIASFKNMKKVVILDHHKTMQAALEDLLINPVPNVEVYFDMSKSGAMLSWEYFNREVAVPRMIQFIQDRDLWRWEMPYSKEVAAFMRARPLDFKAWDIIAAMLENPSTFNEVVVAGKSILEFTDRQVEIMGDKAIIQGWRGFRVPVVNATAFWSEVGEYLYKKYPECPFAVTWYVDERGYLIWSLRSPKGGFDVGALARQYGGGGHNSAAGFTERIIEQKTELIGDK